MYRPRLDTRALELAALATALSLTACGGSDKSTGPGNGTGVFPQRPNPLTVSVTLDRSRSASAQVPTTGGTVRATAADGSRFTLTVPPNALLQATTITLTPVTAVGNLPLSGGLVAAVHFEPEGLRLYEAATLLIEPKRSVPAAEQVGFGYYGTGENFHLEPLEMGQAVKLRVMHFSGAGVAQGTAADVAAQLPRAPTPTEAQLQQQIATLISTERAAQLQGQPGDPQFGTKLAALMDDYFKYVVEPKLQAAERSSDLNVIRDALVTALSWERMAQLLGIGTGANWGRVVGLLETLLTRVFNDAYNRCKASPTGNIAEASVMTEASRMAQLLGIAVDNDPRFPFSKVLECASGGLPPRVELRVDATFVTEDDFLGGGVIRYTSTATSTVLLNRLGTTPVYQGTGPIRYSSYTINSSANREVEQTVLGTTDGVFAFTLAVNPDGSVKITRGLDQSEGAVRPAERFRQTGRGDRRSLDIASATSGHWVQGWDQLFNALGSNAFMATGLSLAPPGTYTSTVSRTNLNPGGSPFVAQATVSFRLNPNP